MHYSAVRSSGLFKANDALSIMKEEHRGFQIYSGAEPVLETLLGRISRWCPRGTIDYARPDHSIVELTRFRLPCMTFDDTEIAERFGLELGRLLVDCEYRDLVIKRDESETRRMRGN